MFIHQFIARCEWLIIGHDSVRRNFFCVLNMTAKRLVVDSLSGFREGKSFTFGICQVVFPKMLNCSEPLKLRTGALPLRFATPGYFQNMNREGSACAQGPPYSVSGASGLSGFSHWLPEGVQSHTRLRLRALQFS